MKLNGTKVPANFMKVEFFFCCYRLLSNNCDQHLEIGACIRRADLGDVAKNIFGKKFLKNTKT